LTLIAAQTTDSGSITRASGSSFYAAMRILPREQREAMYEIYAFCRRVDDIADSGRPRLQRRDQLQAWRADIDSLYGPMPAARVAGLVAPTHRFGLRREDFHAIIDGMEMDVVTDIRAPDLATLDLYCDRVASAVGRLSVCVFGMGDGDGRLLAHHLGRALQLTNILRDLDEDAAAGRLYLPREALQEAGIEAGEPASALASPALGTACSPVIDLARKHFAQAEAIMARNPRPTVRAPRIMGEVYRSILETMVARGWSPPRNRVGVARSRLLWIILRNAFI
jgi:presqualene diphosphate synthase